MSQVLKRIAPPFFASFLFFSCQNDPQTVASTAQPVADTIQVKPVSATGAATFEVTEGSVTWSGRKTTGDSHTGTLDVSGGTLLFNQGQIVSGTVALDMNSIAVTDIKDPGEKRDLESHLKDSDFFETKKYPAAEFKFGEVLPSNTPNFNWVVVGELTMKGKTNPVNIPVRVTVEGDVLRAESPNFPINRTQWGVNFRSGLLGTVKDKVIDDMVPLSLKLTAKKKSQ